MYDFLILFQESSSDMNSVTLTQVSYRSSGVYKCEVSTEAPNFDTVLKNGNMTVLGKIAIHLAWISIILRKQIMISNESLLIFGLSTTIAITRYLAVKGGIELNFPFKEIIINIYHFYTIGLLLVTDSIPLATPYYLHMTTYWKSSFRVCFAPENLESMDVQWILNFIY